MERYELFITGEHLILYETISDYEKMFADERAINEFNKIVKKKLGKKFNLKSKNNGIDKYIEKDNIYVEFNDYLRIMDKLEQMKKQEFAKKKKLIFGTALTTAASAIMITTLTAAGPKSDEMPILTVTPIEKTYEDNTISKDEKNTEDILIKENTIKILSEEEAKTLTYSDKAYEANIDDFNEDNIAYVDAISNYDDELERNVSNYDDIINEISEKWGVSNNLIRDIMKQESHGGTLDNKMQIEFDAWKDQVIKVYNFKDKKYEKIVLTDTPEKYSGDNQTISREELNNPKTNISVGAIILAYTYKQCDYNFIATVVGYNYGTGATNAVLEMAAAQSGKTKEELINDVTDTSIIDCAKEYRNGNYGDSNYFTHVISMSTSDNNLEDGKKYTMMHIDDDGIVHINDIVIKSNNLNKTL